MTKFLDGPAAGQTLALGRAPKFLRAVFNEHEGIWDALDQVDDTPEPGETLHAYRVCGKPGKVHIRARHGGGFFALAEYRTCLQPTQQIMRDTELWRAWCREQQNLL